MLVPLAQARGGCHFHAPTHFYHNASAEAELGYALSESETGIFAETSG